jgi:hypothetical protein
MDPMTRAILLGLALAGCSPRPEAPPLASPSGEFAVTAEVSGEEAGPTRRHCVRLKVEETKTGRVMTFQTGASDVQKWAIAWSPAGSLVLYSSDIGTLAYDIRDGRIAEREPDAAERESARDAYRRKYDRQPPA